MFGRCLNACEISKYILVKIKLVLNLLKILIGLHYNLQLRVELSLWRRWILTTPII